MKKRHSYLSTHRGVYLSPTVLRVLAGFLGAAVVGTLLVNLPDIRRYVKFETM
jgi:hypothetical protein